MVLKVWSGDPQEVPGAPQQNEEQIYHFNPFHFVIGGRFDNSRSISSQCITITAHFEFADQMFLNILHSLICQGYRLLGRC